ncbi:uncharacterized protein LOC122677620 [Cervus elaphus]|uniref:uncharacterized protein LOC122677620 n=1 Tax=Cervus elaphus TaxID=9860 RepID=UPI001CC2B947|nr:uncharacterized protein LOC122677620 [Cervus elaphus]
MPVGPTVQPSGEENTIKADARLPLEACGWDSSPDKAQRSNVCTKPRAHLPVQARAWTPTEGSGATWMPWASMQPSPGWAVRHLGFPPGPHGRAGVHPAAPGAGHLAPATPGCGDRAPAQGPASRERAHQQQARVLEGQVGWQGCTGKVGPVPAQPQPEVLQATPGPPLCPPVTSHSLRGGGRSPPSPCRRRPLSGGVGTVPESEVAGCEVSRRAWHSAPWQLQSRGQVSSVCRGRGGHKAGQSLEHVTLPPTHARTHTCTQTYTCMHTHAHTHADWGCPMGSKLSDTREPPGQNPNFPDKEPEGPDT